MAKLLKLRRGTTSQHGSFTGAEGEVTVDTDKETLVVHDGSTAGGHPVAAEDMANVSSASIAGRLATDSIATSKIAAGALPTDVTVASANIVNGTIINEDVNASAAIAGTKVAPAFGSQNLSTSGTAATGALTVTGNITVSGTVDGVDVAMLGGLSSSSGVLTNGVTATTQSASDNSTKVATTAYTDTAISNLVDSSPSALNTLNELAAALGDDANFSSTVNNNIATKLPLAGGQMTGNITFSGSQTVDGRDLSADGSKLDGIESGATADQTGAEIASALGAQSIYTTGNIGRDANDHIAFTDNTQMDVYINNNNEFRFEADGDFHADGDVIAFSSTVSSDRKLKENIEVIPNALEKVQALNGVSFNWKRDATPSAGVIAQEVQAVLPEAVREVTPVKGGDSHLSVNYHALTSILIESIKELKAEIEELKGGK
tara:strand:- start:895 stop:2193 length:1299 start_codon:yes stop_codon:yes gene_type:complete